LLAELAAEVPTELVAVTVKVYAVPDVKPVTTSGDPAPVAVFPPGDEVAVYDVIVAPPLSEGAENATETEVSDANKAVPIVGARGTLAATALVVFDVAVVAPLDIEAVTIHLIVVPT